jgi:dTDP-4-dehydrorhamnose 3,5-epimerase-like enzyme
MTLSLFLDVTFTTQHRPFTPVEMAVSAKIMIRGFQGHRVVRRRFEAVTVGTVQVFAAFIRNQLTIFIHMVTDTAVILQKKNMVIVGKHGARPPG